MATLQKLRNNAGILISVVIGLALIAFIMGDLMETGGGGGGLFGSNQLEIAVIAGESVDVNEFEQRVRKYENYYQQNTGEMPVDEVRHAIREQVWNTLVQEIILEKESEKTGLRVESTELFELIQGDRPHQLVIQSPYFTDPETRRFDKTRLITFLRNLENYDPELIEYWFFIEDNILRDRLYIKYMNLVNKAHFTNTLEAQQRHFQNNTRFDIEFIHADYNSVEDDEINLSDREIKKYYDTYQKKYKQEASRDIYYAYFDIKPSEEDDQVTYEWIVRMVDEFKETETPEQFINMQSDTAYKNVNYAYGELPDEINDFMFSARIGDVYGPYKTNETYKIARLLGINQLPDSIRARHILFQPDQNTSRERVEELADSVYSLILDGADFAQLAREFGADGTAEEGGDLGWFSEGMMVQPFSDSCFFGEVGNPMLVETQFGQHIVEVTEMSPKREKRQVGILKREVLPSSETYQKIYARANTFAGKSRSIDALKQASEDEGVPLMQHPNLKKNASGINNIAPNAREIIQWTYEASEGDVSETFESNEKFIVVAVDKVREKGIAPLEDVRENIVETLLKEHKANILKTDFNKAKDSSPENDLKVIADKLDKTIQQGFSMTYASHSVTGVGIDPKMPAAVSALDVNTLSPAFSGIRGVYMAFMKQKDEATPLTDYSIQKMTITNERTSRTHTHVMNTLKDEAGIEDKRLSFF